MAIEDPLVEAYDNYEVLTIRSIPTKLVINIIFCSKISCDIYIETLKERQESFISRTCREEIQNYVRDGFVSPVFRSNLKAIERRNLNVDPYIMFAQVLEACEKMTVTDRMLLLIYDEEPA